MVVHGVMRRVNLIIGSPLDNSGDIAINLELLTSLLVSITFLRRMLRGQRLLKVTEHMQLISAK